MEKYLLELIRENNRIIIPNFGAFIVSREKGKNILFNNFLTFNDGLLISHICTVENVDSAVATKKVEDYVSHVKSTLDETGSFKIEGIGEFIKDESRVLRFQQEVSELSDEDKMEVEDVKKEDDQQNDDTLIDSDSNQTLSVDNDLLDLDTGAIEQESLSESNQERSFNTDQELSNLSTDQKQEITNDVIKEDNLSDKSSEKNIYIKKENKSQPVGIIILIAIIFLLLLGSILWFFTGVFDGFKDKDEIIKTEQQVTKIKKVEQAPVIDQDSSEIYIEQDEVTDEKPVIVSTRNHHIIVGSFKDESNANTQLQIIMDKGYTNASILHHGGRYLLSVESYPSVNLALQRQEELLNEMQMENWVLSLIDK